MNYALPIQCDEIIGRYLALRMKGLCICACFLVDVQFVIHMCFLVDVQFVIHVLFNYSEWWKACSSLELQN